MIQFCIASAGRTMGCDSASNRVCIDPLFPCQVLAAIHPSDHLPCVKMRCQPSSLLVSCSMALSYSAIAPLFLSLFPLTATFPSKTPLSPALAPSLPQPHRHRRTTRLKIDQSPFNYGSKMDRHGRRPTRDEGSRPQAGRQSQSCHQLLVYC
jgi:hypothetical protein